MWPLEVPIKAQAVLDVPLGVACPGLMNLTQGWRSNGSRQADAHLRLAMPVAPGPPRTRDVVHMDDCGVGTVWRLTPVDAAW